MNFVVLNNLFVVLFGWIIDFYSKYLTIAVLLKLTRGDVTSRVFSNIAIRFLFI